jgi:hypothetical protein
MGIKNKIEKLAALEEVYDGESVKLKYRADKITQAELLSPASEAEFCAAVIAELAVDGEAVPVTAESFNQMEFGACVFLCQAIVRDVKKTAIQKLIATQSGS